MKMLWLIFLFSNSISCNLLENVNYLPIHQSFKPYAPWQPKENNYDIYSNKEKCFWLIFKDHKQRKLVASNDLFKNLSLETIERCKLFFMEQKLAEEIKMKENAMKLREEKESEIYRSRLANKISSSILKDFYTSRY